jgi:subtilisin family serine protease
MRTSTLFLYTCVLIASHFPTPTTALGADSISIDLDLTDHYIIKFKSTAGKNFATDNLRRKGRRSRVKHEFRSLKNVIAAVVPAADLDDLFAAQGDDIDYIEQEQVYTATLVDGSPGSWGLVRTSTYGPKQSSATAYSYNSAAGAGVDVFVLDSGIQTAHTLFGGRAANVYSAFGTAADSIVDGMGHGTHVAGTIGASKYGIAPQANLWGVQVLDANGSGTTSSIIAGIEYVTAFKKANPTKKCVANLSLGGAPSQAMDDSVKASIGAGVVFVLAAGNSAIDCTTTVSPARVVSALTIGSVNNMDTFSTFSNYGCIDISAPGENIVSLAHRVNGVFVDGATRVMSGTSMSAPHAAGVAALLMSFNDTLTTPQLVMDEIKRIASKKVVLRGRRGSNLDILYNGPK